MTFRLGLKTLATFGNQLGTMLEAGLPIRRGLSVLARGGGTKHKRMYARIADRVDGGDQLSEAMEKEGRAFPILCLRLVQAGEIAGGLDRVLKRLGDYYAFIRSLWGKLIAGLVWPLFEYWALVFVLALVAYISQMAGIDLGLGFTPTGAIVMGVVVFATPIALYFAGTRMLGGNHFVHELVLRIPVVGNLVRTAAIARFSWTMEMMTSSGVRMLHAIQWSLEATTNGAFIARGPRIIKQVSDGEPLGEAFRRSGLFPSDYIEMIHVAQESGSVPDMFARLARMYFEKMETAMKVLSRVAGIIVWILVACIIIYFIFRLALHTFGQMQGVLNDTL